MSKTSDPSIMLQLRSVTKTYGHGPQAVRALSGVDLDGKAHQLMMLVGPSGCGKTTLLSIIGGMLEATSGNVEVCGVRWSALSERDKTRHRGELVGYVFQQFRLIPTLTIELNVAAPLLVRGMNNRAALQRAGTILEELGLGDRRRSQPNDLSAGMQQRVAVARALVGQPRLLLCDEPTGNLDSKAGQSVMELIASASRGTDKHGRPRAAIVVTHDHRALPFADVIYHLEGGRLLATSPESPPQAAHEAYLSGGSV